MSILERLRILESGNLPDFLRKIFDLIEERYIRRSVYDEFVASATQFMQETSLMNEVSIELRDGRLIMMTANGDIDLDLITIEDGDAVLYDDGSEEAAMLSHLEFDVEDGYLVVGYNFGDSSESE